MKTLADQIEILYRQSFNEGSELRLRDVLLELASNSPSGQAFAQANVLTVNSAGILSYSGFVGKSLSYIKQYFRGEIDGENIIGRDGTTLESDGALNLGLAYANQAIYLTEFISFDASVIATEINVPNTTIWDNVNRADTPVFSGAGVADSGQAWQTLAGQAAHVSGKRIRLATTINQYAATAIERSTFGSTGSFMAKFQFNSQNNGSGRFWFGKDAENGFHIRLGYFTNQIIARVNGVETVIATEKQSLNLSQAINQKPVNYKMYFSRKGVDDKSFLRIVSDDTGLNFTVESDVLDEWEAQIFGANTDVKFFGLSVASSLGIGCYLKNFRITNL